MSMLPSFLEQLPSGDDCAYIQASVSSEGSAIAGRTHALWWPCRETQASPDVVLIFIPGNPGMVEFYTPFLNEIHSTTVSSQLAILAHSHIGHVPNDVLEDKLSANESNFYGLSAQVTNAVSIFDRVISEFGSKTRVVLIGHSVGAWIVTQIMKARSTQATAMFLLFPTISEIASTPNGRRLSWLFRPPIPYILSSLSSVAGLLPQSIFRLLYSSWPSGQLHVLRRFVASRHATYASLIMACDEMKTIRSLDVDLLNENKTVIYFAEKDDWVGEQRDVIIRSIRNGNEHKIKFVHGEKDIPHAFCINHGEPLASVCCEWLQVLELI